MIARSGAKYFVLELLAQVPAFSFVQIKKVKGIKNGRDRPVLLTVAEEEAWGLRSQAAFEFRWISVALCQRFAFEEWG